MNESEFRARVVAAGLDPSGKTVKACRLVLVDAITAYKAALEVHIDQGAISRALAKLRDVKPAKVCPCCGHKL